MSKLNYKLYKNFLPKKLFTGISNLHQDLKFPWFYSNFVGHEKEEKNLKIDRLNNFYFSSLLYEDGKIFSPHFNLVRDVLDYIPDFKQLIRVKSNLYTNLNKIYEIAKEGLSILDKNKNMEYCVLESSNEKCMRCLKN